MKLVWCPDIASKAYIDTVKSVSTSSSTSNTNNNLNNPSSSDLSFQQLQTIPTTTTGSHHHHHHHQEDEDQCELFEETSVAELISAMAGGWNAKLIVETWSNRGSIATSIGLSMASRHTGGRHVCVVPDHRSRVAYTEAMHRVGVVAVAQPEVVVGEAEEVMGGLVGIDFLVVDSRRKDSAMVLRLARFSQRGAVLVCKNASSSSGFRWRSVVDGGARVVRSAYLPVGGGVEIAHVGAAGGGGGSSTPTRKKGASRWVRHVDQSGEEHVYRR